MGNITTDIQQRTTSDIAVILKRHDMSSNDIARLFGLSQETVRRRTAVGDLPHIRVGNRIRYAADDVAAVLLQVSE